MLGTHDLAFFALSVLLLAITPGPDTLYIVGRSTTQGWKWGAMAVLGVAAGIFVHILAAAVGLSALLAASATAFTVLKLVGAAYLVYIGVTLLLSRTRPPATAAAPPRSLSLRRVFTEGFFTNVLNPKVALFFLAFLPQFIDADAANKPLAFLFLGVTFNVIGSSWNLFTAWSAVYLHSRLRGGAGIAWLNRAIGAMFIYLGVKLAFTRLN
ncbi:MAG: lysine transporter LysE [Candidatus Muproteobacteria bacterium RBG_16_60_9]|uniref:Lysine transporter LysE n=1 Tax=Candidatus Muproteobacteria bacterium RBG_16_60_9 TaxID=1817755 RepID=A0A1F6VI10_9PROT|nr:MAG: lysine transporter LysE [Candidatus Muproteobacteria bacterium RBG_16_60_9]